MSAISPQPFKVSDQRERRVEAVFAEVLQESEDARDALYAGAWECHELGQVLINTKAHPLVGVIARDIFVSSFPVINEFFSRPGTFEFYLTIFRGIYGEAVEVEFDIPAPGILEINIVGGVEIEEYEFMARRIEDDQYVYENVVDHEGDTIMFQAMVGIQTPAQITNLVKELAVAGITTRCNLVFEDE